MTDADIYDRHVRKVYGFFMAKTLHRQTAEDLTSDVFTIAFEQFNNPEANISDKEKYLYGVMKHRWLHYLRNKYANVEQSVEDIDDFSVYVDESLHEFSDRSLIDRALPYIQRLPEKQQQVLLLRFRDGLSPKEICAQLEKDMNYVKTTQRRGLASLKQLVEGGL